ncbi:hypothetical protein [Flavobacterium branchiicola]|uniref:YD repeat-containing protein n=1 Tax=Flavobacterium branchiicola TaxID=1114875 RepID=A0ABV9PA77_9FLAO|nr:hypothetical protein [Flavobacterium branchiicola]MBS7252784.1 RHS repeat protein [Flavobacterium branchiicola]
MTQFQKRHRIIATFFLLIFFPTLLPNNLFATNNGPNSFEAANFEPVDAADMVNLVTGDMSYVLPLLNVPSPEGGYPLALSNHAGIAMAQEASWVGLGWSLNPGAINRSVNGYPDDIEIGNDNTFIYDQGGTANYYDAGVGVTFYNVSAGLGAYWGSNKTFGGSVSLGLGGYAVTVGTGTFGPTVGLGYGGSLDNVVSNISTGVSFNSLKDQGSYMGPQGTGASSNLGSFSLNNYDVQTSSENYSMGIAGFYFYYGHTKVKYSLFEEQIKKYTGILYPNSGSDLGLNHDVNKLVIYNDGVSNISDLGDSTKDYLNDNVLLPNYDKYKVQAQGLSGSITPAFTSETKLKHENIFTGEYTTITNGSNSYNVPNQSIFYNTLNNDDTSLKLNNKIFFEFENTNSSFLRIDRSILKRDIDRENQDPNILSAGYQTYLGQKYAKTQKTDKFSETSTNENIALKVDARTNRKRTGKSVEVFTNSQILSGTSATGGTFIEANNLNRNQPEIYRPESIGGYRITDIDGKVYHYSLPVINFEIWYKNFIVQTNEDSKFMERESNVPYATDWLLTAITGPDYVDTNGNNKVDSQDYGYWVEFDYGKWSDGYIWNGSTGNYDIVKGSTGNDDRYEYYRGRKQIYYLDAVKTRTHTAYFVKSLRKDAQSDAFMRYTTQAPNSIGFDKNSSPKKFTSNLLQFYQAGPVISNYGLPSTYKENNVAKKVGSVNGYKASYRYADFPAQYSLKLDKIILLKNDKNISINKASGAALTSNKKAFLYENRGFQVLSCLIEDSPGSPGYHTIGNLNGTYLADINTNIKEIAIHQSEKVIDANDVTSSSIEQNAEKIINFQYDANYSLMPNSFHSSAGNKGKLTLKAVEFLGHQGIACIPKYQFNYNNPSTSFNVNNEDGWGYNKLDPTAWCLNEITTPMGSKMNIQYESDDYNAVAAKSYTLTGTPNYGKGGGIRVKEISYSDGINITNKTNYYYNQNGFNKNPLDTNYKSSGVTSFVPSKDFMILPYASELPPPVIMYSNVSVEESNADNNMLSKTNYSFETLTNYSKNSGSVYNIGNYLTINKIQDEATIIPNNAVDLRFTKYDIKNRINNLGRLLSAKKYNTKNQTSYSLKNEYRVSTDSQDEFGTKQESFLSLYNIVPGKQYYTVNSVSKTSYPNQLIKTTNTQKGYTSSITFDKFDLLTGLALETTTTTSDGKTIKNKIVPAYTKPEYYNMGSRVDDFQNKNMLSQTAANYIYLKESSSFKITGVDITTWSNIWAYKDISGNIVEPSNTKEKIWRKHKSYVWNGSKDANGIYLNYTDTQTTKDDGFSWLVPSRAGLDVGQAAQWKQVSEITLYDHYSNPLEVKGINKNYVSSKMGNFDSKLTVSGSARYGEIFYSSAETNNGIWVDPEISVTSTSMLSGVTSHTGKQSVETTSTSKMTVSMKNDEHRSGKYKISIWVEKSNSPKAVIKINGNAIPLVNDNIIAGNWQLKTAYVQLPKTACTIDFCSLDASKVYFDDLMIRPVSSSIVGYVYNDWGELTYTINNSGLATKFEYDAAGRVIKTSIEVVNDAVNGVTTGGFKVVKTNIYNNRYLN